VNITTLVVVSFLFFVILYIASHIVPIEETEIDDKFDDTPSLYDNSRWVDDDSDRCGYSNYSGYGDYHDYCRNDNDDWLDGPI
jgi:hypothetical protein